MCCGWLAICGVPIWAGFFSKDEILWKVWSTAAPGMPPGAAKALWFIGAVTALLTAVYMTRLMVMTFWGSERFGSSHEAHAESHADDDRAVKPHESPWSKTIPLIVLAILSTVGGLVGVPYAISSLAGGHPENYFEEVLAPALSTVPDHEAAASESTKLNWQSPPPQEVDGKPAFAPAGEANGSGTSHETLKPQELNEERLLALVSVLIALSGIGIGWVMFQSKPLRAMPRLLENKYYVDEIYDATIIQPIKVGSREGLWKIFDVGVIDGILHTIGGGVVRLGRTIRYMQIGFVRGYAAIILAGALIIIGYFAYSGAHALRFLVR
jgi:NADH-quinone oxidoreductase subunit L